MPADRNVHRPPLNTASANIRLSKEAMEANLSKEGMEADIRALCAQKGLTLLSLHIDEQSGAIRNRVGFIAWLDDAREGRVDHLVAWHVDRMTREGVNVAAMILDVIEGKDVETGRVIRPKVRLLDTKGLDSDPGPGGDDTAFRFRFLIAAEVARAERERMRDRSKALHRRLREAGRWAGGTAPFGFRVIDNPEGAGKVLAVDDSEAAVIRECVAMILAGESLLTATRWMNGPNGAKPRRAQAWRQTTLMQVLTGMTPRADNDRRHGHPIAGKLGEGGRCPAIISADEAAALRALLVPSGEKQAYRGRQPVRLLSGGLLKCAYCGQSLIVSRRVNGKGKTWATAILYRCNTHRVTGMCNAPVAVSAESLDDYVTRYFLDTWGSSPEYVRRAEVTGAAAVEDAEQAKAEALTALGLSPTAEAFQKLTDAQAALDEALTIPQEAVVHVVPSGRTIQEAWDASDVHARRELLTRNLVAILVKKGQRGRRGPGFKGIDPARVEIIGQPPHSLSDTPERFRLGGLAVEA